MAMAFQGTFGVLGASGLPRNSGIWGMDVIPGWAKGKIASNSRIASSIEENGIRIPTIR